MLWDRTFETQIMFWSLDNPYDPGSTFLTNGGHQIQD